MDHFHYWGDLIPTYLMIASFVIVAYEHGLLIALFIPFAHRISHILNTTLKENIQQERPKSNLKLESYGMPSGHSQSCAFDSTLLILLTKFNEQIILFCSIMCFACFYHRVHFQYHTMLQVVCGALAGIVFGIAAHMFLLAVLKTQKLKTTEIK